MTVFEPRTSNIASDRSTNWATTTAHGSSLDRHLKLFDNLLFLVGPLPATFYFIFGFSKELIEHKFVSFTKTGIEPRTYGVGSDRASNWVTTTAQLLRSFVYLSNLVFENNNYYIHLQNYFYFITIMTILPY